MKNQKILTNTASELREQAEKKLLEKEFGLPADFEVSSPEIILEKLHELRVHQIELEMQNEELRRTHLELEQSQSRYFDLYDMAPVGYVTLSDKGIILQANLTSATLVSAKRGDLIRNLLSNFIFKEDQDIFYRMRGELLKTNEPQVCELRMRKTDGTLVWVQLEAVISTDEPVENSGSLDKNGNTKNTQNILRIVMVDISDTKKKEQSMREANWRMESIIEGTQVGTWEWNVPTGEMVINNLWASMVGYTLNELAPIDKNTWHKLTHPDDIKLADEMVKDHFSGRLPGVDIHYRMRHNDGHWVWIHDRGRLITRTAEGEPWMMFGTHTDVTQRIQMQEALKESNERFSKMFERHHSVMMLVDPQTGKILDANRAAEYFYGYTRSVLTTMSIFDLNTMPKEQVMAEIQEALLEKKNVFNFSHRLSNGEVVSVEVHSTPIMIGEQKLLFSIIHDITDRKKAEAELLKVNLELQASLLREQQMARTDVLTSINNRRCLFEILEQQFETAKRYHQPLSIVMFDIDHFKKINDIYGHAS
ncbi:MAG: PAS domain S-box protein, partial [Chloroflexota bacterium]